jgi:hypothetical protein
MNADKSNLTPKSIQDRFGLSEDSPLRDESSFFYNFQLDDTRLGFAEITCNHPKKKAIFWKFYPIDKHDEQEPRKNWYEPSGITIPELERRGIGSFAHVLMTRNLVQQLMTAGHHPEEYRAIYVATSGRMHALLERLGILKSRKDRGGMPLMDFYEIQRATAESTFGYDFSEVGG